MSRSVHWHGFGPWIGARSEYAKEGLRRPGPHSEDPQTKAFLTCAMTPVQLGHWLLRRHQASAELTWTDVEDAVRWIHETWTANPPGGDVLPLSRTINTVREALRLGSDVTRGYYSPAYSFVSYSVICCPNRFHPDIPCPLSLNQSSRR